MAIVAPFRPLRPKPEFAARVASPPYDVVSLEEAREAAAGNPYSFLRVSRAELEFPDSIDPYSEAVYRRGASNLQSLMEEGVLVREKEALFCVYQQCLGAHKQTGLVALASVDEYDRGAIRKHEFTRPVKEADRVRIIEIHESQSGPVLLYFRNDGSFEGLLEEVTGGKPDLHFVADDQVQHSVWSLRDESIIRRLVEFFRNVEALYIADGHHRTAAASRVRANRGKAGATASGHDEDGFLAVLFPHDQLQILPYNRVVRDLNGMTPSEFMERLSADFELHPAPSPGNPLPHGFDVYLDGRWHRAQAKGAEDLALEFRNDPARSLAVSVLTERVLDPLLGISDQRSDSRIEFVSGIRGPEALAAMVDGGEWSLAFWLYPTTVEELMRVSDAERVMPPKSTWFEPKLRDGLFVHLLGDGQIEEPD